MVRLRRRFLMGALLFMPLVEHAEENGWGESGTATLTAVGDCTDSRT
jgi:hypothetical protein